MAQATHIIEARSQILRYDHAMIDELIEVTGKWDDIPDAERTSWMMDWDQVALEDLPRLAKYSAKGELTNQQMEEFRRLLRRIEQHRDLIHRFGLTMPRIPVET